MFLKHSFDKILDLKKIYLKKSPFKIVNKKVEEKPFSTQTPKSLYESLKNFESG